MEIEIINYGNYIPMAQLGERLTTNQEVMGRVPLGIIYLY